MNIEIPDELFSEEELRNTPRRFEKFLKEWSNDKEFEFTTFPNPNVDEMIILKNILTFLSFILLNILNSSYSNKQNKLHKLLNFKVSIFFLQNKNKILYKWNIIVINY